MAVGDTQVFQVGTFAVEALKIVGDEAHHVVGDAIVGNRAGDGEIGGCRFDVLHPRILFLIATGIAEIEFVGNA